VGDVDYQTKVTSQEKEQIARHLLEHPTEISGFMIRRQWAELAALAEFVELHPELVSEEFKLRGWHLLNPVELRRLAVKSAPQSG
jgi:hypothetical protein